MLLDATCIDDDRQRLASKSFYNLSYGRIFAAILSVHDRRRAVDTVVIAESWNVGNNLAEYRRADGSLRSSNLSRTPPLLPLPGYCRLYISGHIIRRRLQEQRSKKHFEGAEPEVLARKPDNAWLGRHGWGVVRGAADGQRHSLWMRWSNSRRDLGVLGKYDDRPDSWHRRQ